MHIKIIIQYLLSLLISVHTMTTHADQHPSYILDLYRSHQITSQQIQAQYKKEFEEFTAQITNKSGLKTRTNTIKAKKILEKITSGIAKSGKFSFIHISPVLYPGNPVLYITIDVVDEADNDRMPKFLDSPNKNVPDQYHLLSAWNNYEKAGFELFYKNSASVQYKSCTAWHCAFGFEHPSLKKYQEIFNKTVPAATENLIAVLQKDRDEKKRAAAAFLLAHIRDGHQLIKILSAAMYDPSEKVRNNVMRVLGMAISRMNYPEFAIDQVIKMLDFPYLTDRNKALCVLLSLADQPYYAKYIKEYAEPELHNLSKLSQPNLSQPASQILTKINKDSFPLRGKAGKGAGG